MGRKPKLSGSGKPFDPTTSTEADFYTCEEMMSLRLGKGVGASYLSHLNVHRLASDPPGYFTPNFVGLMQRLSWKDNGLSLGRAKALRVAIMWHEEINGVYWSPAQAKESLNYVKAIPRAATDESIEKDLELCVGTIDEDMLKPFFGNVMNVNWFRQQQKLNKLPVDFIHDARDDLAIAFVTGLRSCQLVTLTKGCFKLTKEGWIMRVPKIHDPGSALKETVVMLNIKVMQHPILTPILTRRLDKLSQPSDRVCPNWNREERYNTLITYVANSLGWPSEYEVKFNGVHCFRRGAIRHIRVQRGDKEAILFAGHTPPNEKCTTHFHYFDDNETRREKGRAKKAKSSTAQQTGAAGKAGKAGGVGKIKPAAKKKAGGKKKTMLVRAKKKK